VVMWWRREKSQIVRGQNDKTAGKTGTRGSLASA